MAKAIISICLIFFIIMAVFCGLGKKNKDIKNGSELILRTLADDMDPAKRDSLIENMMVVLEKRLEVSGIKGAFVERLEDDKLLIGLPNVFIDSSLIKIIQSQGDLEFRLLETPVVAEQTMEKIDHYLRTAMDERASPVDTKGDKLAEILFSANLLPVPKEISSFCIREANVDKVQKILSLPEVQEIIPRGSEFLFSTGPEVFEGVDYDRIYLVKKKVLLAGETIEKINPTIDQFHNPQVEFVPKSDYRTDWSRVTGDNLGKPLAIVIDGRVESASTIQDRIIGPGRITMRRGATLADATNLANILRYGAYPVKVEVVDYSIIGNDTGH